MTIHSMRVNYYYCHIELQFIPLLSFLVFNPNSAINSLSTIWTNRHVKHYVFFPIVRFHEKLFFFSLQKIFICRVAKEIAYVRENTPQNIDSIKSYPTSLSGTTFFCHQLSWIRRTVDTPCSDNHTQHEQQALPNKHTQMLYQPSGKLKDFLYQPQSQL